MSERILIIEDEIDVAELLAHHLRAEGFSVEIFNNGRAAFTAVKSQTPALIVLDLMLPEISGLDLCRMIKSNPGTSNVPIVMLSARIQDKEQVLLRVGDLVLDRSRHEVKAAERVIDCTATEFKLLAILMERQGRVQERDRLLTAVWGYDL